MCKACPVFRMSIRKRYIENRIQQVVDFDDLKSAIDQMFPVKPEPEPEPEPIKVFEIDDDYTQTFLFSISKKDGWDKFLQKYASDNDAYLQAVVSDSEVRYFYSESETQQAGCTRCGSITCSGVGSTGIICKGK